MLASTGPSDAPILIPSNCSYNLLLKDNAVFLQVSSKKTKSLQRNTCTYAQNTCTQNHKTQANTQNLCKETHAHMEIAKNLLRPLAFNLIDLHNIQIFKDKKKINIIKNLWTDFEPDKGNGTVVIRATEYYTSIEKLFSDKFKFKQLAKDPTPTRLTRLQRYQKQLNKRRELDDNTFTKIQPQNARIARTHGLPKMH